jgi:hypothetical protein
LTLNPNQVIEQEDYGRNSIEQLLVIAADRSLTAARDKITKVNQQAPTGAQR